MAAPDAVSVVIPALDSVKTLGRCLTGLIAQEGADRIAETIVVDGGSRDGTPALARSLGAAVLANQLRHAAAGRQAGLDRARTPLIAFLDSDCIPLAGWLRSALAWFDEGVDGVGGPVIGAQSVGAVERFCADTFTSVMRFGVTARRVIPRTVGGSLVGGNMMYRASSLRDLGGFDLSIGNYGEDLDLLWRYLAGGSVVIFEPAMVVTHHFPDSVPDMMRSWYRYGRASSALASRHLHTPAVDWRIYRLLLASAAKAPFAPDPYGLRVLQLAAHVAGKAAGSLHEGVINL